MISDEEILRFVQGADGPVVGSREAADHFDMSVEGISKRLNQLVEDGALERKMVGNSYAYWVPDD